MDIHLGELRFGIFFFFFGLGTEVDPELTVAILYIYTYTRLFNLNKKIDRKYLILLNLIQF